MHEELSAKAHPKIKHCSVHLKQLFAPWTLSDSLFAKQQVASLKNERPCSRLEFSPAKYFSQVWKVVTRQTTAPNLT